MKQSIFARTFIFILGTITLILLVSWIFISFFADDFYYNEKLSQIEDASDDVHKILQDSTDSQDAVSALKTLSIRAGVDISIFGPQNQLVYSDFMMNQENGRFGMNSRMQPLRSLPNAIFNINTGEHIILQYTNPSERIDKYVYGERYLNGILVVIQLPIQAIDDAVSILKDILKYMMIVALALGAVSAYVLSRNITKPLVELNRIAIDMGKLNFSKKYTEDRADEIGQLGKTLNKMSKELQCTIEKLQDELQKEKTLDVLRKQFVAQVSHEMQTPLAVIQGYLEALEDGIVQSEEEKSYHYEIIKDEIGKMTKIIKDLLDLSQLEAGTFKIKKESFILNKLIKKVSNKYSEIVKKNNIEFIYNNIEREVTVNGDDFRLEQVLTNFIKNALEHTNAGGQIDLTSEIIQGKVRISIRNTGQPIPEEDLPHIWESFYKSKVKAGNKGTGLGLAISKQILNLHGAQYGAYNDKNGVAFWFEIEVRG